MTMRRQFLRSGLTGALTLGLAACGFRMRGAMLLPFSSLRTTLNHGSALGRALLTQLETSGVTVVGPAGPVGTGQAPEAVDVVLEVLGDQRERAVVGKTVAGQVRELTLRYRFKFRVRTPAGKELIEPTELLQERDLSYSETEALGKEAEEELLYRDMVNDIARQVMYRLAAIRSL
ncbi:MAG TPA: LPS assembly lipoprotein LptE [Macromonas sp.]|nr:LPS assembly lipoprotein LptE [Macromonas sp.]